MPKALGEHNNASALCALICDKVHQEIRTEMIRYYNPWIIMSYHFSSDFLMATASADVSLPEIAIFINISLHTVSKKNPAMFVHHGL
jgi:hypothetical protein